MSTLAFPDTHNMVVFLEKPAESDRFHEIINFLNANQIHYALTVNPTIYTSCIEQFWAMAKVKTVNEEHGTDCLPTAIIFEELARMGYEKPSQKLTFYKAFFSPQWKFLIHTILQCLSAKSTSCNEFSSTMASAIICLATNQKFNLSKYIFDAMKIFANMKREGKDFFERVTPLFATMMVQANQEEGEDTYIPIDSQQTPITTQPSTSKPQKKQSRRKQKRNTEVPHPSDSTADVPNEEHVPTYSNDPLLNAQEITNLKLRVKKLEKKAWLRTHKFKRLYKVGVTRRVESLDDERLGAQEDASKQGRSRIKAIDRDAKVTLVETQRRNDENDDNLMFDTGVFDGDEIVVETEEPEINAATTTKSFPVSTDEINLAQEITLAQALATMKSAKPKEKDVV
ncbi:hypothetical protein Tco_1563464 [Tanacetum coccineum]